MAVFALTSFFVITAAHAEVRMVAIGDSGIRGKGVSDDENYPAQLERALNARGHKVSITNAGVNGDTTDGVLARLDRDVPADARIAIINVGVNDVAKLGRSPQQALMRVQMIVQRLQSRGIAVFNVNPLYRTLARRRDLHVEAYPVFGNYHLNAAGYAIVVDKSVTTIERLVRNVELSSR